ncbi:MAG: NifU family protein [Alphaproteobacteria bacterium]|nr:NifU family protein [Alphaproteobacteria bacterium]
MFIQTETTPNPATLKFLPGRDVLGVGTANFPSLDEAEGKSPLAEALFHVGGVTQVFLGADFVSVTKDEGRDWQTLKPQILGTIMDHFTLGAPVMVGEGDTGHSGDEGDNPEVVAQIKELLDLRVRPAVAQDGGDIVFRRFEDGVVYLAMQGACAGCPSSTATLKMGIENMLKHYIPEVQAVHPVPY